jgi:heme o synthase
MRNNKFLIFISILAELTKFKVTLLVTFTTATGYLLFSEYLTIQFLFAVLGILILASGSAALNQVQEKDIDKLMPRTQNRPIPSERIKPFFAIIIAVFLILAGAFLLYFGAGLFPFFLGVFTLLWYNGIYTYLKRITAFAVVPGSVVGAIPPMVGWTAAGGIILDYQILSLAFYLFVWQIPHFWLLLILYGKDYEIAGLPSLTKIFNSIQIKRLTFIWILATIASAMLFVVFSSFLFIYVILVLLFSIIVIVYILILLIKTNLIPAKRIFILINLFTLLILVVSILNSLNFKL